MAPGSLAHAEGMRFSESMWGSGRERRTEIYANLDAAEDALKRAMRQVRWQPNQPRGSAERTEAARMYWAAKANRDRAHDEYMRLPEEVERGGPGGRRRRP